MRQHLRDAWKPGVGVLGVTLSAVGLALVGVRGLFLTLAALFAVWLGIELLTFPSWPRNRVGRDALFSALGAGVAAFLLLGLTWNTLDAPSHRAGESAATRAAANEVFYELLANGAILKEVAPGEASPLDAYEVLKREAFAREGHVLAAALPFQKYQLIQDFYEYASYPLSWMLGRDARKHIGKLRSAVEDAQVAIFPYVH